MFILEILVVTFQIDTFCDPVIQGLLHGKHNKRKCLSDYCTFVEIATCIVLQNQ